MDGFAPWAARRRIILKTHAHLRADRHPPSWPASRCWVLDTPYASRLAASGSSRLPEPSLPRGAGAASAAAVPAGASQLLATSQRLGGLRQRFPAPPKRAAAPTPGPGGIPPAQASQAPPGTYPRSCAPNWGIRLSARYFRPFSTPAPHPPLTVCSPSRYRSTSNPGLEVLRYRDGERTAGLPIPGGGGWPYLKDGVGRGQCHTVVAQPLRWRLCPEKTAQELRCTLFRQKKPNLLVSAFQCDNIE